MLTRSNTQRAIEAIKTANTDYFHGSLSDYLLEVLEASELPPTDSEFTLLFKELEFYATNAASLDELKEEIAGLKEEWVSKDTVATKEAEEPKAHWLKDWHLNVLSSVAFIGFVILLQAGAFNG